MLELPRWKYVLVLVLVVLSTIYAVPNLFPHDPAVQITANRGSTVDTALRERTQGVLERAELPFTDIALESDNTLLVRLPDPETQLLAADRLRAELGDGYTVALNLASTVPAALEAIRATPMLLGLDLQGGVHFLMEVDQRAALDKREGGYADDIRALLRDQKVRYNAVNRGPAGITVQLREGEDRASARALISAEIPQLVVEDSASDPLALVAQIRDTDMKEIIDSAIDQNIGTLNNRINELGVSEPIIQRQGANRIVVQLPGVQDTAQAKKILGATATLEYRHVVEGNAYEALESGRVPPDARIYYRQERGFDGKPMPVLLSKKIIVSGDQLIDASAGFDPQNGQPEVNVTLNNVGAKRMTDYSMENVGNSMAVVFIERTPETRIVNGEEVRTTRITEEVISVARVNDVLGKRFRTTGLESSEVAAELALLLRAGSLAAPVDIVEERVVGPSLGKENIESGQRAIVLGFVLVCLMMMAYYRLFGVISVLALFTNLLMLLAVLSAVDATLTMPGIAGIVLTLGMAVDGNVLICERIREELRNGNTPAASIKAGYERAWTVILDANVAKIIAAIALFSFGSGPVRGFALVLFFGVLTSMFSSVTVSRVLATLIYGGRRKIAHVSV